MDGAVAMNSGRPCNAQQAVFSRQPFRSLQGAMKFDLGAQNGEQPLVLPRLLNKIARAAAHGLDRQVHVAPCGHHNDRERAVHRHNIRKQVQPFLSGSRVARVVQVDQHRVVGRTRERLARQLGRADDINLVALRLQQQFNGFKDMLLVVGRQNAGGLGGAFAPARRKAQSHPVLVELGMS